MPVLFHIVHISSELFAKIEFQLAVLIGRHVFLEQSSFHERHADVAVIFGHRDRNTEVFLDLFGLAEDDIENEAIHRIVGTVKHSAPDILALLTETVHTAFALFVASRVPSQVVMNDGIEVVLKVDTFGQAIRRHENRRIGFRQFANLFFAFLIGEFTGNARDAALGELSLELVCHIMSRRDILAEDDRTVCVARLLYHLEHIVKMLGKALEFRIFQLATQGFGLRYQALYGLGIFKHRAYKLVIRFGIVFAVVGFGDVAFQESRIFGSIFGQLSVFLDTVQARCQGTLGGKRTGRNTTQQSQRRVPHHPTPESIGNFGPVRNIHAVFANLVKEVAPFTRQLVGDFLGFAVRKSSLAGIVHHVNSATLHQMTAQVFAELHLFAGRVVHGQIIKPGIFLFQ